MTPWSPAEIDGAPCRLACFDCHSRLTPETSYIRPVADGWHYLCAACYALTDAGRVVPTPGFQLYAMKWTQPDGYTMVGSERSSRGYIEQELERHRVNGWLNEALNYEIVEVPGNVEVRSPRPEAASGPAGTVP